MKVKRHRLINFSVVLFIIILIWVLNTFTIKKTIVQIYDKKIKDEITLVQLTDLHGSSFGVNNNILISKIRSAKPDLIIVTGDMYTHYEDEERNEDGEKIALELMSTLAKEFNVYFVNGEHDNRDRYKDKLKTNGVHVLDYKMERVKVKDTMINLYGINNVYYSTTFNLKNEFKLDDSVYNILMAHICNAEAFTSFGMDLSICGDTHGGQVRLPGVGAIYDGHRFLPEIKEDKNNSFIKGIHELNDKKIFISSGLGNYPIPVRFFNRPEIAVIKLKATQ